MVEKRGMWAKMQGAEAEREDISLGLLPSPSAYSDLSPWIAWSLHEPGSVLAPTPRGKMELGTRL